MPDSPPDVEVVDTTITPADAAPAVAADTTDAKPAADSSTAAQTQAEKPTMLDAVKTALKPKADGESPPSQTPGDPAKDADPASKADSKAADDDELSEEELSKLHGKTKKRFQRLTTELAAATTENGALKQKAESYDKLNQYIRDTGITNQEANGALQLVAMLRSDPKGARERLAPIMAELDRIVGEAPLPEALQQRVTAGYLTEADARAIVRSDAAARINAQRLEQTETRQQEERQARETKSFTDSTIGAIETWEAKKAEKDPDWHLKRAEIADQVELAITRKSAELQRPWFPNPAEAVELSQKALDAINKRNKRFGAAPAEIRPVENGASPRSTAAPKTMLDVVRQSLSA